MTPFIWGLSQLKALSPALMKGKERIAGNFLQQHSWGSEALLFSVIAVDAIGLSSLLEDALHILCPANGICSGSEVSLFFSRLILVCHIR